MAERKGSIRSCIDELRTLLTHVRRLDLGYPLGTNEIRKIKPQARKSVEHRGLPRDLLELYAHCDGLSVEDVRVGYFVDRASRAATASDRGEPIEVRPEGWAVVVFGSDGGGGRFALRLVDHAILHLGSGAVRAGVFYDSGGLVRVLAPSVSAFVCRLRDDVEAFVDNRDDWEFMI